jgi:hypothetical protein
MQYPSCSQFSSYFYFQLPFLLSAVHPYISQCLHTGSFLYRYSVYVLPLPYEIYQILALKVLEIF